MLRFKGFKQDEELVLLLVEKHGARRKNGVRMLASFRHLARASYEEQIERYRMYQRLLDAVIHHAQERRQGSSPE